MPLNKRLVSTYPRNRYTWKEKENHDLNYFPRPSMKHIGWIETSKGYHVPKWVYNEATYNKDGCMKEEIFDR